VPCTPYDLQPVQIESSRPRHATFAALSVPEFRRYAVGQGLVSTGTWVQNITQDWLVLQLTHSAQAVGWTAACQFLPALLLGAYGGSYADRLPKKRLLICTQTLNCLLAAALAGLTLTGAVYAWHVYLLALLGGLVWVVDNPVRQTIVSELVPHDRLGSAIALNATIFQSARLMAPAAAGVLITTLGSGSAFAVNTFSFLAALLAWSRVHPTHSAQPGPGSERRAPGA
jgi:MFS family permease